MKLLRVAAPVALLVTAASACANDGPRPIPAAVQPEAAPAAAEVVATGLAGTTDLTAAVGEPVVVQVTDNTFGPQVLEVAAGTEVVWVNGGRNAHNVLSDVGFEVATAEFAPGDEYHFVFTVPGEYPYHCSIHGTPTAGMNGTITVTEAQ